MLCAALIGLVFVAYAPVANNSYIYFDDTEYVFENPVVLQGITSEGLAWALTTNRLANWHPLTWMSHMLDCDLFRLGDGSQWAGGHHLVNVLGHSVNAALLLLLLWRMTGSVWRSALAAAVFALHPQRVESVAWISERKDVLCVLFGLLTLHAYVGWLRYRGSWRYGLMVVLYALSLAAKPTLVTLPFIMLLLDFWPLRRIENTARTQTTNALPGPSATKSSFDPIARCIIEKIPLFLMALASSAITFLVQRQSGAMDSLSHIPAGTRLANAAWSVIMYVRQWLWPTDLTIFYPYPQSIPLWQPLIAGFTILAATVAAIVLRKRCPHLPVGWLWFVGTLVPVLGIVQVGDQARADRYTYFPMIGAAILLAWSLPRAWAARPSGRLVIAGAAALLLLALTWLTFAQARLWRNSETLFSRALEVTQGNVVAHSSLGLYLYETNRLEEAQRNLEQALQIRADYPPAMTTLALVAMGKNDDLQAELLLRRVIERNPKYATARLNLGTALARLNRLDEAVAEYRLALQLSPDSYVAAFNLGSILAVQGKPLEALAKFDLTLRLVPSHVPARGSMGMVLVQLERYQEAIAHLELALAADPDNAVWHNALGVALLHTGKNVQAVREFQAAIQIRPDYQEAQHNLQGAMNAARP